ncbi:hypothetical protein AB6A40_004967 [Gnathostoma spinigerum]|uniref:Transcription initiation factor TFIID subunit 6 n=1 Tax=Gnathostoma spinigerum TaxID=75299 RepID=A0ABD6EE70_9BILA
MHQSQLANGDMHNDQQLVNGGLFNSASTSACSSGLHANQGNSVEAECDASYVKFIGESVGISNLTDPCASQVAVSVTYAIKDLIEQARKFASHGRRKRLLASDLNAAMTVKGYPPMFGFTAKEGLTFRCVGSLGRDLFVADDREIELTPIVNAAPAKVPIDPYLKAHWLVIDGEQPAVPENPVPPVEEETSLATADGLNDTTSGGPTVLSQAARTLRKTEQVQIKTMTTHALSVEQQIFFKEITEAIMGSDDTRRTEALHSLQTDAGLQALLPRFSLAISEGVRCNIVQHNLAILIYLMRMIQSLAANPALSLDRCLHELLPSILSCILSKQLCARPDTDNHWALREFSSRLLASICKTYNINNLRSRVTQILTKVWRGEMSTLSTLYGSLYALNELGVDTIRATVVPRAPQLYNEVRKALVDKANTAERISAEKLQGFVTKILINFVRTQRPAGLKDLQDYRSMFGGFGDSVFRAISMEISHISSTAITTASSAVNNGSTAAAATAPVQRNVLERRSAAASPSMQRFSVGSSQSQTPRLMLRQQSSPRAAQPFVNVGTGGRLQPVTQQSGRQTQPSGFYVGGGGGSQPGSYPVRPGVKKVIMTSGQRAPQGAANDGYRNA